VTGKTDDVNELIASLPSSPGSGCPQLHHATAAARRRRSLTSTRTRSASWRSTSEVRRRRAPDRACRRAHSTTTLTQSRHSIRAHDGGMPKRHPRSLSGTRATARLLLHHPAVHAQAGTMPGATRAITGNALGPDLPTVPVMVLAAVDERTASVRHVSRRSSEKPRFFYCTLGLRLTCGDIHDEGIASLRPAKAERRTRVASFAARVSLPLAAFSEAPSAPPRACGGRWGAGRSRRTPSGSPPAAATASRTTTTLTIIPARGPFLAYSGYSPITRNSAGPAGPGPGSLERPPGVRVA
jgi:hypothetical protein